MKKVISAAIFLLTCLNMSAQSVGNRLQSFVTESGSVYYISNKKLTDVDKGMKKFEYDMTYVPSRDSLTVNFTLITSNPSDVTALTICNENAKVAADNVELLYHEIKKGNYVVRTSSKVAYSDMKPLMLSQSSMSFVITRADGQSNKAQYTSSQWKKERALFEQIIYLINK